MKRLAVFTAAAIMVVALGAAADPTGASTTVTNANQSAETTNPGQVTVEAGNVSQVDVSQASLTDKWAGFYGNISASKVLGDGASNMFSWTASTFNSAKVVAVPSGDPAPSTINPVTNPNSFLGAGFDSGVASANNTFTKTGDVTLVGSTASGTATVNTYNSSGIADPTFTTYLVENGDATGNPVYIAEGTTSAPGFKGNALNYQLLGGVGESASYKTFDFYLQIQ
ncbi:MAG: hypothetical protein SVS85_00485 [Candidatus Nanohaloarchaea archaeon]|nr:hypothetical protein [Candidatus Nanohaloarchaea archaeon]